MSRSEGWLRVNKIIGQWDDCDETCERLLEAIGNVVVRVSGFKKVIDASFDSPLAPTLPAASLPSMHEYSMC